MIWVVGGRVLFLASQLEERGCHSMRWRPWRASGFRQGELRGETQRRGFFACWVWAVLETDRYTPGVESQRKDPGWKYQNVKWLIRVCPGGSHGVCSEKTVGLGTHPAGTPKVCMTTWRRKKRRGIWGKDAGRADCTADKARVLPSEPATVSFQALVPLSVKRWGKQSKNQALYRENYWYNV